MAIIPRCGHIGIKWVKYDTRTPMENEYYLVYSRNIKGRNQYSIALFKDGEFDWKYPVTLWRPIPSTRGLW